MCAIQEISARIGRVTGRGIAGILRKHYPLQELIRPDVGVKHGFHAVTAKLSMDLGGSIFIFYRVS